MQLVPFSFGWNFPAGQLEHDPLEKLFEKVPGAHGLCDRDASTQKYPGSHGRHSDSSMAPYFGW